jgi:glycogen(starch) synthase
MLVLNPVTGDSRVQKVAWSAANAGWDVTLLGTAPSGPRGHREEARLGHARVVRVRVDFPTPARRIRMGLLRRLHRVAVPPGDGTVPATGTGGGPAVAGPRRWIGRLVWDALVRDAHWERTQPQLLEAERAFAQVVDEVDPDLLHAHDYTTIAIAVRAAERAGRRGRTVRVVYDAHEYLPGVRGHSAVWHRAFTDLERTAVAQVDAVVTVSEGIAELLQERYALPRRPTVVANTPLTSLGEDAGESAAGEPPSLRERIGLPADVPLLVYSGAVAPQRGVTTMVEALPLLPDVHAAVVAPAGNRYVKALLETASGLGVTDRLHVAPYVPPNQVPEYLSSATVGVIPILHYLNHELALVTKYYEYMHARLPIVVSDVKEMAGYTRELGNGEVFAAGDAEALATAVRTVLADRERYAARYADEVLAAHTWERQVEMLYNVYVALLGVRPDPRSAPAPFGLQEGAFARRPEPVLSVTPQSGA